MNSINQTHCALALAEISLLKSAADVVNPKINPVLTPADSANKVYAAMGQGTAADAANPAPTIGERFTGGVQNIVKDITGTAKGLWSKMTTPAPNTSDTSKALTTEQGGNRFQNFQAKKEQHLAAQPTLPAVKKPAPAPVTPAVATNPAPVTPTVPTVTTSPAEKSGAVGQLAAWGKQAAGGEIPVGRAALAGLLGPGAAGVYAGTKSEDTGTGWGHGLANYAGGTVGAIPGAIALQKSMQNMDPRKPSGTDIMKLLGSLGLTMGGSMAGQAGTSALMAKLHNNSLEGNGENEANRDAAIEAMRGDPRFNPGAV